MAHIVSSQNSARGIPLNQFIYFIVLETRVLVLVKLSLCDNGAVTLFRGNKVIKRRRATITKVIV